MRTAREEDELLLISEQGIMIRSKAKEISCIGRATQGVRLMKLDEGDSVAAAALMVKEEDIRDDDDVSMFDMKNCQSKGNGKTEDDIEPGEDEGE